MCVEGAVMAELAEELLAVHDCGFRPCHVNKLANEFRCYPNYTTSLMTHVADDVTPVITHTADDDHRT